MWLVKFKTSYWRKGWISRLWPWKCEDRVFKLIILKTLQCTMGTLYSFFSSQLNEVGYDFTLHNWDIIQHIFPPTSSLARKTLLWMFLWASNSKFVIFPKLYPCINYRILAPQFLSKFMGILVSPRIIHRAILDTGGSYCTNSTLCTAGRCS